MSFVLSLDSVDSSWNLYAIHLRVFCTSCGICSRESSFLACITLRPRSSNSSRLRMACRVSPMSYFLKDDILMKQTHVLTENFSSIATKSAFPLSGLMFVLLAPADFMALPPLKRMISLYSAGSSVTFHESPLDD